MLALFLSYWRFPQAPSPFGFLFLTSCLISLTNSNCKAVVIKWLWNFDLKPRWLCCLGGRENGLNKRKWLWAVKKRAINSHILILFRSHPKESGNKVIIRANRSSNKRSRRQGTAVQGKRQALGRACKRECANPLNHTGRSTGRLNSLATSAWTQSGLWGMRTKKVHSEFLLSE